MKCVLDVTCSNVVFLRVCSFLGFTTLYAINLCVGINLECIDACVVLERTNDIKSRIFAAKH